MANKDINNAQGIFAPASSSINTQQSAVTSSAPTFTVTENLPGAIIGPFRVNDQDGGQTHIFSVDDARFEFTGTVLKLKDEYSLDYEEASLVPLVVTVTDSGGLSNQMNVTVGVLNAGEPIDPVLTNISTSTGPVPEDIAIGESVGLHVKATDPDGDAIRYELVDNAGGLFAIDPETGEVTAAAPLDYETAGSHVVLVRAVSTDGSFVENEFNIVIGDVDETVLVSAVEDSNAVENTVDENSAVGTTVGITAQATAGPDDTVTYSLIDDADGRFAIDPQTGEITVVEELDYETASSHTIRVLATASNGTTSEEEFTIAVNDLDEIVPVDPAVDTNTAVDSVDENSTVGTTVGITAQATAGPDDTVSYSLIDDADGHFAIDPQTGEITVASELDYETASSHTIRVLATASNGTTSEEEFTIAVNDLDEIVPVGSAVDTNTAVDAVDENSAIGTAVGITAQATAGSDDTVSYSLIDDADGRFAIDPQTGEITVAGELDYETASSHTVRVLATASNGTTSEQDFTIAVSDVDETVQVSVVGDTDDAENTVDENSAVGTSVGITASAAAGSDDTVTYSLLDDADGRFAIDPQTGEVTVAGELDYEEASSHTVRVLATASNGTTSEEDFTIAVNDNNEAPVLTVESNGGKQLLTDHTEDFENGASGWSNNTTTDGGDNFTTFLGRFGLNFWAGRGESTEKTFAIGNGADSAVIEFNLYEIGSWDGENFIIEVAGEYIEIPLSYLKEDEANSGSQGDVSWSLVPETGAVDLGFELTKIGWPETGGVDQIHKVRLEINNPGAEVTLKLGSELDELYLDNESWGIDNLRVQSFIETSDSSGLILPEGVTGASVAILSVEDPDTADTVIYSVDDDRFEVVDGNLKLKADQSLDYETEPSVTVTVTVTDEGGLTDQQTLTIGVINVNEIVPVDSAVDTNTAVDAVDENSAVGTAAGITAQATAGPDDTITYSLIDDADGRFAIDPQTGEIIVAGELDYETASSHTVRVLATASNGTTSEQEFTIAVGDVDETVQVSAVGDTDTTENTVNENSAVGTAVGITANAAAGPDDTVTYSLTDDADGRFAIDPQTGAVTVVDELDYEEASSHTIRVLAIASNGTTSEQEFTIAVGDVDESTPNTPPAFAQPENLVRNGSFENVNGAKAGNYVLLDESRVDGWESTGDIEVWNNFLSVSATDGSNFVELDGYGNTVDHISQSIETAAGHVYQLSVDVNGRTEGSSDVEIWWGGELITTVVPETGAWNTFTFEVEGNGQEMLLEFRESGSQNDGLGALLDNVFLTDTNALVADGGSEAVYGRLLATDEDDGAVLTFSVTEGGNVPAGFTLNPDGSYSFDPEDEAYAGLEEGEVQTFTVPVTVTDEHGATDTDEIRITVNGTADVNEVVPVSPAGDTDTADNTVDENSAKGTKVGITAQATAGPDDTVTYSLINDADGRFAIDPQTGEITVAGELDYEEASSHTVRVLATASNGTTSEQEFAIAVGDVDETVQVSAVGDTDTAENTVNENSVVGTAVGITANAAAGPDDAVTYSLTDDADGRFAIDPQTGEVTVAGELDYEEANSHTVRVLATASNGTTSEQEFTIAVGDVDESTPNTPPAFAQPENLVRNGSFENVNGAKAGNYVLLDESRVDGWESTGDIEVWNNFQSVSATDGSNFVELDGYGNTVDHISQSIETAAGHVYQLSVDVNGRTEGSSDVEIWWGGELITTVVSETGAWNTFTFEVEGNGQEMLLEFRESGSQNDGLGALLDNVSLIDTNALVADGGGEAVHGQLLATDDDDGAVLTFSVADGGSVPAGFTLNPDGSYSFDPEDEAYASLEEGEVQAFTIPMTVTDEYGATDTDEIRITVNGTANVNEVVPVSPAGDTDTADNIVDENSAEGMKVGITAQATAGPDDTVTYSLVDDADGRFAIDSQTGEITVAGELDYEEANSHTVRVLATASNGTTSEEAFDIAVSNVNEAPVLTVVSQGDVAVETFENGATGWSNNTTTDGGADFGNFLGRFGKQPGSIWLGSAATNDAVEKTFALAGDTNKAVIEFDLYEIDSWDGEDFIIEVAGERIAIPLSLDSNESVASGTQGNVTWLFEPQGESANLGFTSAWYIKGTDQVHRIRLEVDNPDSELTLRLSSTLDEWIENESWGIDNLSVQGLDASGNPSVISVTEGVAGAIVAELSVTDPDGDSAVSYSVDDDRFEVVDGSLKLKADQSLDYESERSVTVTVTATDAGGLADQQTLTIGVINVDEITPLSQISDLDTADNAVDENSEVGTRVGIIANAIAGPDDSVTYTLVDDADGRFAIDAQTGEITVAGALNYEANNSHSVRVQAIASHGAIEEQEFVINVQDVNERPVIIIDTQQGGDSALTGPDQIDGQPTGTQPGGDSALVNPDLIDGRPSAGEAGAVSQISDLDTADNAVDENSAVGTSVGITANAVAGPDDTVSYALTDDAEGRFAINSETGEITVAGGLNYEASNSHAVQVQATSSNGSVENAEFDINVRDVNEAPVIILGDQAASVDIFADDSIFLMGDVGQQASPALVLSGADEAVFGRADAESLDIADLLEDGSEQELDALFGNSNDSEVGEAQSANLAGSERIDQIDDAFYALNTTDQNHSALNLETPDILF